MSDVKIPFELFADITTYFLSDDLSTIPPDLIETIRAGVRKKAEAIIRREDYAERIRQKLKEHDNK